MIRVTEIKFKVDEMATDAKWRSKIAQKLGIPTDAVKAYYIRRESIDARKGVVYTYSLDVETTMEAKLLRKGFKESPPPYEATLINRFREKLQNQKDKKLLSERPIVVGFGPAGMFAALTLAEAGLNPIVLEMGEAVDERTKTVEHFWQTGELNETSNVQFGEGGAGTFSDGKLTTRVKDERIQYVIETFIAAGAPEVIRYKQKPHIGTDYLKCVVKHIRNSIIALGGEVRFQSEVAEILLEDATVSGVKLANGDIVKGSAVIIATGHSARKLFYQLYRQGVAMSAKPFAVGVRIEHPQRMIDHIQYGDSVLAAKLGAAEYKLTHTTSGGRSVYSFCMCPGGEVVASASEAGHLVVNGMSQYARALSNSNSALLVNVTPDDFPSEHPLAGIEFQRQIEAKAFRADAQYAAPCCRLEDFLEGCDTERVASKQAVEARLVQKRFTNLTDFEMLEPTYRPKTVKNDFSDILPIPVLEALKEAIPVFGRKIPGFDHPMAIITGVETRSSSPVRIHRDPVTLVSVAYRDLYPCGEGAGYAGGITSSAIDGIKVAESILLKCLNH
ncbi:NAD(P)/FAD-dependent oxidoreductase [Fusibacter paucivorans]|uniref:NAD(P)/FAD-dependent oxidoreductase n=1 Tax=Fusibacter paucivorans TaxID=76009 RepID=A0ABS5PSN1_9FIRM|nr:NAD(P)/FAD-dependent oxidoreductase [Fusibacter paucivorans]MBS7528175.1 NAD(P)/FAD-dependent oxidoreductase [Fusibacter paucivorans]